MNKKIFLPLLAIALMLAGCMLTSCSNANNGEREQPYDPSNDPTTIMSQSTVTFASFIFDYCNISVTYDGKTVALTNDNTEETTVKDEFGSYTVRKYMVLADTCKVFPKTITYTCKCQPKDGVDFLTIKDEDYYRSFESKVENDKNSWLSRKIENESKILLGMELNEADPEDDLFKALVKKYFNFETTVTFTLKEADMAEVKCTNDYD